MSNHYINRLSLFLLFFLLSATIAPATAPAQGGSPAIYTIGCILPLTGRNAVYGNATLEAVMLAAGVFDPLSKSPFRLVIEDSKSETEAARLAAQKLAAQTDVICILGPLGSAEAIEAAQEAQKAGVPILTFTQNEKITDIGNCVFRYFSSGRIQVRTLVKYAVRDMGIARFAILYPDDDYGREMMKFFREEVLSRGGQIKTTMSYDKIQTDFEEEIIALKTPKPALPGNNQAPSEFAPDFDALFIPDSYLRVNMIVPQLAFHNVTGVHLLGTGAWDSPDLLKENSAYLEGAIFTDDFYLDSFYPEVSDFIDAFYAAYRREPGGLEALVYDAARIAVKVIAEKRIETREQFRNSLLEIKSFPGVTGKTSISVDRDVEKDAFLLMVRNGQIMQIK